MKLSEATSIELTVSGLLAMSLAELRTVQQQFNTMKVSYVSSDIKATKGVALDEEDDFI